MLLLIGGIVLFQACLGQQCGQANPGPSPSPPYGPGMPLPHRRPLPKDRTFISPVVERHMHSLLNRTWRDADLATLLWNCLPNTLDTTVSLASIGEQPDTFIITGDNKQMWLRDSACQLEAYVRFAAEEPEGIGTLVRGLMRRHVDSVLLDPFANSFVLVGGTCPPNNLGDMTSTRLDASGSQVSALSMGLADRKFEKDSLLYVLRLARLYFERTHDTRPYDSRWRMAVQAIIDTLRSMQRPLTALNYTKAPYTYQKSSKEPKDTLDHGVGKPHRYTGMVRGAFLPSDDAYKLPYHIPGNAMAVVELRATALILRALNASGDVEMVLKLESLAKEIDDGVKRFGIVRHASGVQVFAQVVDGFGNYYFGDDANVPSLLSLPHLGYLNITDPIYSSTRKLLLSSETNPYFSGPSSVGFEGIGSEDASGKFGAGWIWHISLMMRALTATSDDEVLTMLKQLRTSAPDGLMHESFWFEDPTHFTREWFGWANSLFGDLLLRLVDDKPHLLFSDSATSTGASSTDSLMLEDALAV